VLPNHLAHHLESGIESLGARPQRFELPDEGLDEEVFDISFIDVDLVTVWQRLLGRGIQQFLFEDRMNAQLFTGTLCKRRLPLKVTVRRFF